MVGSLLTRVRRALTLRDATTASTLVQRAEAVADTLLKKSFFERCCGVLSSLFVGMVLILLVRTIWFELYEIPTGSMRPTLEEQDRLIVSKTAFGINIPFTTGHLLFCPDSVRRLGIVIFTGKGMDMANLSTKYFGLFPGIKQFVKRVIGKPGDRLYFYGGRIYGIDANGNDISDTLQAGCVRKLDYVPYIHFDGRIELVREKAGYPPTVTLRQMNEPVATFRITPSYRISGALLPPYDTLDDYYDLWGYKHYGVARLITGGEAEAILRRPIDTYPDTYGKATLFMEIRHHPSVKYPSLNQEFTTHRLLPGPGVATTLLPLSQDHLRTLFRHMYTGRFVVKGGMAASYGNASYLRTRPDLCLPLHDVPDGTYEFYYGKGYRILKGGIMRSLPSGHPLCRFRPEYVRTLYDFGMSWIASNPFSARYVYYRGGTLFALGSPLMGPEDPFLTTFIKQEYLKQQDAPASLPYVPFDDDPPPFREGGTPDPTFIEKYGIRVPEGHYLVLGDNHAMSADSRDFGFVPAPNLRGTPALIFWPIGSGRFGSLPQPSSSFPPLSSLLVWGVAVIIVVVRHFIRKRSLARLYEKLPKP